MCCRNETNRKLIFAIHKYKQMRPMKVQKKECRGMWNAQSIWICLIRSEDIVVVALKRLKRKRRKLLYFTLEKQRCRKKNMPRGQKKRNSRTLNDIVETKKTLIFDGEMETLTSGDMERWVWRRGKKMTAQSTMWIQLRTMKNRIWNRCKHLLIIGIHEWHSF